MTSPDDRHYTTDHEWVQLADGIAVVGITAYAAEQLGEIVYVDLPEVGSTVTAGTLLGEVESTKSVGEVLAPLDGEVVEVNAAAAERPELVGEDPFGDGWLVRIAPRDGDAADGTAGDGTPEGLLSAADYDAHVAAAG